MTMTQRFRLWRAKKRANRHLKAVAAAKINRSHKAFINYHKDRYHDAVTVIYALDPSCRLPLWII